MALNFTQTDTTAPLGVIQACSPVAPTGDADAREGIVGGTAGVTANAAAIPAGSKVTVHCDELRIADDDSLDGGPLTYRLNVSTAQNNLTLEDIYVCRVNSSGVSQETLGSSTGLGIDISAGGVFTPPDITLSAASAHDPGDRIYITVAVANSHSMTSRNLEVLPNQNIDTPFTASGVSGSGSGVLGTLAAVGVAAALITGSGSPSLPGLSASGAGTVEYQPLTRTHSGLLHVSIANDGTNPFSLGDWEQQSGVLSFGIDGTTGGLDIEADTDVHAYVRLAATASRTKRMVQAVLEHVTPADPTDETALQLGVHMETGATGDQICGEYHTIGRDAGELHRARELEGTSALVTDGVTVALKSAGTLYRFSVHGDGSAVKSHDFLSADTRSITTTQFTSGHAGLGTDAYVNTDPAQTQRCHEFWDCEDDVITCTGLPTGHKLKVRDSGGAVLKSETEASGTATLNLFDIALAEIVDVVVTDASDVIQKVFAPAAGDYVGGGDTYEFAASAISGSGSPSLPALSASGAGKVYDHGSIQGWQDLTNYLKTTTPVITSRPLLLSCWGYLTAASGLTGNYAFVVGQDGVTINNSRSLIGQRINGDDNFNARERDATTDGSAVTANGTLLVDEWFHMAGAFVSATLRESWIDAANKATDATNVTAGTPDSTHIGARADGDLVWGEGDGGALGEFSAWDLTGFSEADRNALVSELATLVGGKARNPLAIDADVGQPWSGKLVWYVRGEDHTDLVDRVGANDLTTTGTLSTFTKIAPVDEPPAATISGSGSPDLPALTATGLGGALVEGSGAPALPGLTSTGVGSVAVEGSGTATLPALAGSGSGGTAVSGSGAPALPALTATGAGEADVQGTGTAALPALAAAGSGTVEIRGTGAPSLPGLTATGAGVIPVEGSGSPSLPVLTGGGAGTVAGDVSGTGSPSLPALTASGAGAVDVAGSGSPSLPALASAGAGAVAVEGSGSPTLPALQSSGAGAVGGDVTGTGSPSLPALTASGVGTVAVVGVGSPSLPALSAAGAGTATDYPDLTIANATVRFHAVADDISGVSDGASVTAEWVDRIGSRPSAVTSGDPTYVANALNGHAGVRFRAGFNDILEWAQDVNFSDGIMLVVGVFHDEADGTWAVALNMGTAGGGRNMLAFRDSGGLRHAFYRSSQTEPSASSNPLYDVLQIFGISYNAGTVRHYSDPGTGYAHIDTTGTVQSGFAAWNKYYVGGDVDFPTNDMFGDILDVIVWEETANIAQADLAAVMQALDDWYRAQPPATPTLSLEDVTNNDVAFSTDAFVAGEGGEQSQAEWQVTTDADTGYTTPVINVTSSTQLRNAFFEDQLAAATAYRARMRKQEDSGAWSDYSNEVTFTTDGAPDKPTISIVSQAGDHIVWASSTYSGDAAQAGAHWQVTLSTDTGFASPVKDYETTASAEFEDYTSFGVTPFTEQYIGRVRHLDENGIYSAWSDASAASPLQGDGQFYTAFAERPVGTNIATDVPADWDEVWADDYSQWPITSRADATCQVVSRRSQVEGDATAVDPIFWQGFPAVDQQEVFARLIFDEQGTGGGSCSGESSPGGFLCRESVGKVARDDFADLSQWRIARSGIAGQWGHYPDRGHIDGLGAEQTGEDAAGFLHEGGFDSPRALLVWETPGSQPVGYWFQVAHKLADVETAWHDTAFSGIAFAIENDGEHYTVELAHECGIFSTWDWMVFYQRLVGGAIGQRRSEHPTESWKYLKAAVVEPGTLRGHQSFGTRQGQDTGEVSHSAYTAGKVGLAVNACSGQDGDVLILFAHPTICTDNRVRVKNLPAGWKLQIRASTVPGTFPSVTGTGTGDVYLDFGSRAWPFEAFYLFDEDDNLLEAWTPTVTPGIWGGDVINLDPGGVGVGKIGGAAARLTGTPNGTDGSGYFAYLDDGTQLVLAKGDETGGLTTLGTFAYEHGPGVYYNIHLSAVGTAIKAKVWSDAEGEPGAFQIEVTDSDYASGAPGLVALEDTVVDFDVFAAGIGGDPYPTGRNPGTPVWLTPEVPFTVPASDPVLHLSWTRPPMTDDVLGGVVKYELEFQQNGASGWAPLTLVSDQEFYDWDTTSLPAFPDYCVRVRALVGCEFGQWAPLCGIGVEGIPADKESPDGYFFGDWYTGEPDLGKWIRKFQESHLDDDLPVDACWITREFLPVGVGGEAVFSAAYLAFTVTTTTRFTVTPILDGDRLDTETREFVVAPSGRWLNERREIDFSKPYDRDNVERFRGGLRGSYLQLEICATDLGGTGRIEVDGVAVNWSKARETHPWARPFAGELETDVTLEHLSRFYFGTDTADGFEAAIYKLGGSFDFGQRLRMHIEPRPWAPAGPNGEVTATDLYICVTRSNEGAAAVDVTPIVDGDELETTTIQLAGTSQPLTEVLEIPLSVPYSRDDTERLRTGARGTWFSFRLNNSGERPDGEFIVNGAALNMSKARESARDVGLEESTPELE